MLILSNGVACKCSCGLLNEDKLLLNSKYMPVSYLWTHTNMRFLRMCHETGQTHLVAICRKCPARKEYIEKNKEVKKNAK